MRLPPVYESTTAELNNELTNEKRRAVRGMEVAAHLAVQLMLNDDEVRILRDLLRDYLPEMKREVARTDAKEFRHILVARQELAERLLKELETTASAVGGVGRVFETAGPVTSRVGGKE